jgi:hypothetical protein
MVAVTDPFTDWLSHARIAAHRLTPDQQAALHAAWHFRQQCGADYYSTRLLSHFLLHSGCGLHVAQIARLLGIDRTTASRQQGLSSKQLIEAAHHRLEKAKGVGSLFRPEKLKRRRTPLSLRSSRPVGGKWGRFPESLVSAVFVL